MVLHVMMKIRMDDDEDADEDEDDDKDDDFLNMRSALVFQQ